MVIGSNLGRTILSFLFAKIPCGMKVKGHSKPRVAEKYLIMEFEWQLLSF